MTTTHNIYPQTTGSKQALTPEELRKIDAYWRACNYLCAGMIYLARQSSAARNRCARSTSRIGCWGTGAPTPARHLPGFT